MSDINYALLNGVSPASTGTFYGTAYSTEDLRDLSVMLLMPTTAGSGSDTLNVSIQESDQRDFTDPERIRTVDLIPIAGIGSAVTQFTQVVGGTSSPAATLQQKFDLGFKNVNTFIRVKYIVAGTATNLTDITVLLLANRKV
jgi:hypothetical protein